MAWLELSVEEDSRLGQVTKDLTGECQGSGVGEELVVLVWVLASSAAVHPAVEKVLKKEDHY